MLLTIAAVAVLAGCGVPGAPQPPSLELPRQVSDLRALRKGDRVTLAWTPPQETTDRTAVRHPGATLICRAAGTMTSCGQPVGVLQAAQIPKSETAGYVDTLPAQLQQENAAGFATYAIEVENARGRTAGLSNQVQVPLAPTLPPPAKLAATVTADGPVIGWVVPADKTGMDLLATEAMKSREEISYAYRLYRRDQDKPNGPAVQVPVENAFAVPSMEQPNVNVRDREIEWEKTYDYWVTVVTRVKSGERTIEVEGEDSPPVEVFTHDVFPPAVPGGLEAVYTPGAPGFIDLTWAPDTERDLAGYNVFRHEAGAAAVKINTELVKTPAFRDNNVQQGHTYWYSVSAVDLRGNESGKSQEASEKTASSE